MLEKTITNSYSLDDLEFEESTHTYKLFGKKVPSVSELIKFITYELYKKIPEHILRNAAERGKEVHRLVEFNFKFPNLDFTPDNETVLPYYNSYLQFRKDYPNIKILKMELRVFDVVNGYAGTLDILALDLDTNKVMLIDIKTTNEIHTKLVALQTTLYYLCLARLFRDKVIEYMPQTTAVLQLRKDGYTFKPLELNIEGAKTCISAYKLKKNILKKKGLDIVERFKN